MTDEVWRPLGFEGDNAATYDALHEGVPDWMAESFWAWMRRQFVAPQQTTSTGRVTRSETFRPQLLMEVERACRVTVGYTGTKPASGMHELRAILTRTGTHVRVADFLLSREQATAPDQLNTLLYESGSAYEVATRAGRTGLNRRVPEGVQRNADYVMASSGAAGLKLAQAWERVFGVNPDPTGAYALAVRAVEDASITSVVPKQANATLGHVIGQLAGDGDWSLPLSREDATAPTATIVLAHCRALWKGHHDRHGGVPGAGPVTQQEAETALSLAVPLVQWFATGMVQRR